VLVGKGGRDHERNVCMLMANRGEAANTRTSAVQNRGVRRTFFLRGLGGGFRVACDGATIEVKRVSPRSPKARLFINKGDGSVAHKFFSCWDRSTFDVNNVSQRGIFSSAFLFESSLPGAGQTRQKNWAHFGSLRRMIGTKSRHVDGHLPTSRDRRDVSSVRIGRFHAGRK